MPAEGKPNLRKHCVGNTDRRDEETLHDAFIAHYSKRKKLCKYIATDCKHNCSCLTVLDEAVDVDNAQPMAVAVVESLLL